MTLTSQLWFQKILWNKPHLVKKSNVTIRNLLLIMLYISISLCFDPSYGLNENYRSRNFCCTMYHWHCKEDLRYLTVAISYFIVTIVGRVLEH